MKNSIKRVFVSCVSMLVLLANGCSCSKVDVRVEGGSIVDAPKSIRSGDEIKLECSNPQNFGYWYTKEGEPLSYDCKTTFKVEEDTSFKVAPIEMFLVVGLNEETLSTNEVAFDTSVTSSELLSTLNKNNNVTDYALYTFEGVVVGNITNKGISEGTGAYKNLFVRSLELKLYVPQNCVYKTYKIVSDETGTYELIKMGYTTSGSSKIGNKKDDNSAVEVSVTVSHNQNDSYKNK